VAGTLYDPKAKEVIIGATCTLTDVDSGEKYTTKTDNFGDFWFRGLKDDRVFTLTLKKGRKTRTIEEVATDIDLCLGDIPLEI
jgi:tetrathionate reductase subunit B